MQKVFHGSWNSGFGIFRFPAGRTFTKSINASPPALPHLHHRLTNNKKTKAEWDLRKGICELSWPVSTSPFEKLSWIFPTYWSSSDICRPFSRQCKYTCTQIPLCKSHHTCPHSYKAMKYKYQAPRSKMTKNILMIYELNFLSDYRLQSLTCRVKKLEEGSGFQGFIPFTWWERNYEKKACIRLLRIKD